MRCIRSDPPVVQTCPVSLARRGRTVRSAGQVDLDEAEQTAIGVLAESGLVPPLRLVRAC